MPFWPWRGSTVICTWPRMASLSKSEYTRPPWVPAKLARWMRFSVGRRRARPIRRCSPAWRWQGQTARGQVARWSNGPQPLAPLPQAGEGSPEDDGILAAEEIGVQNLDGVEIVVLSACESGLGKQASGEGVLGLQRSFQSAGARSVVASLWSVDDAATKTLMVAFYRNLWEKKLPELEASAPGPVDDAARVRREGGNVAGAGTGAARRSDPREGTYPQDRIAFALVLGLVRPQW